MCVLSSYIIMMNMLQNFLSGFGDFLAVSRMCPACVLPPCQGPLALLPDQRSTM